MAIKKYKQTEIGEIPEEWKIQTLDKFADKVCVGYVGSCYTDYCDESNGVMMLRTTKLSDQGIIYEDLKYVTKEFHSKNKKSQLHKGDILIARHGEKGRIQIR